MKEKILKILSNYTDFNGNTDSIETNLKMNKAYLAEELSTLIQQEREEAVKEVVELLSKFCANEVEEKRLSKEHHLLIEVVLNRLVGQYLTLQSLDKGDVE